MESKGQNQPNIVFLGLKKPGSICVGGLIDLDVDLLVPALQNQGIEFSSSNFS